MYRPIIGTLGYILSPDGQQTLLVHRNARVDDQHPGKYNGLGGKMHPDQHVNGCLRRGNRGESGSCAEPSTGPASGPMARIGSASSS